MTKPLFDNENSFYAEINRIVDEINNGYYTKEDIGNNNYTKQEIDNLLIDYVKTTELTNELNNYYNKTYINENYYDKNAVDLLIKNVNGINVDDLVNKTELTETLKDYATKVELNNIDLSGMYTKAETDNKIDERITAIINSAPSNLDTLGEVAQAIQDNETVVEALQQAIGNKLDKDTVSNSFERVYGVDTNGQQKMYQLNSNHNPHTICYRNLSGEIEVGNPTKEYHATNKQYVDNAIANAGNVQANTTETPTTALSNLKVGDTTYSVAENKLDKVETNINSQFPDVYAVVKGKQEMIQVQYNAGTSIASNDSIVRRYFGYIKGLTPKANEFTTNTDKKILVNIEFLEKMAVSLKPELSNIDIGSTANQWRGVYTKNLYGTNLDSNCTVNAMGATDKSVANKKYVDDAITPLNNRVNHIETPKLIGTHTINNLGDSINFTTPLQTGKLYLILAHSNGAPGDDCKMVIFKDGDEVFSLENYYMKATYCTITNNGITGLQSNVIITIYEIGTE